jgi:hypothetical protein
MSENKERVYKKTPSKRKEGQVITPHLSWKCGKNIPHKGMLGFSKGLRVNLFFSTKECRNFKMVGFAF